MRTAALHARCSARHAPRFTGCPGTGQSFGGSRFASACFKPLAARQTRFRQGSNKVQTRLQTRFKQGENLSKQGSTRLNKVEKNFPKFPGCSSGRGQARSFQIETVTKNKTFPRSSTLSDTLSASFVESLFFGRIRQSFRQRQPTKFNSWAKSKKFTISLRRS